ncbi:MAG: hypothetical protein DRO93_11185 [Candidatus Thorarchaeota archaeon]|nr:MAG: hypothetical protein DRO93_11185 [Candidatus Thorarchaeota archaeon]
MFAVKSAEDMLMKLVFSCPECNGQAEVAMTDEEAERVRAQILKQGRSPTLIVRCENGHEILVTLYNTPDGLGIRDVVIPMRKDSEEGKPVSEIDWLKKAFGG